MTPHPVFNAPENPRDRFRAKRFGALAAAVTAAAGLTIVTLAAAPATGSALAAGRGATVPFLEQEAESAATNGSVIGPDRTAGTLAGEASGRKAVTLVGQGKYVEFTLTAPANAIDVRYSLPDSGAAPGPAARSRCTSAASQDRDLPLTSKYAWYYGSYPFTNNPGDGHAHHFYDETRALLGTIVPGRHQDRCRSTRGDTTASTIDLADFEQVGAAAARPANSVSVTDYGATRATRATTARRSTRPWPRPPSPGQGGLDPVRQLHHQPPPHGGQGDLRGAGNWYSVLTRPGRDLRQG